jgi:UDP-3-O-[3-hydroxymyristoyl] glucosamine N-acyltransferase
MQIDHGCRIGAGYAITGQVAMAGAVKLGNRVILAAQVGITNQVKIGDGAIASS